MGQFRIGQVGLGLMGQPLARRLCSRRDFTVVAYDIDGSRFEGLECERAPSLAALKGCDVILTCLPSLQVVEKVYLGPEGLIANGVVAGAFTIDTSTVSPELAIQLSERVAAAGSAHFEAPLIGSPADAEAGSLYIPLAWREPDGELPEAVASVLDTISRARRVVGGPGTASLTKVMQNGLGLIQVAAVAEAVATCRRVGIDPEVFASVVVEGRGMAGKVMIADLTRLMTGDRPRPTADIAIAAKDAALYESLLGDTRGPGAASAEVFAAAEQALGSVDYTRIIEMFDAGTPDGDSGRPGTRS